MQETAISWSDMTWNCLRGCSIKSPGCHHCYAAGLAARFSGPGQPYEGLAYFDENHKAHWTGKLREVPEKLDEPLRKRKPQMIFVNSMSDLFHEDVSEEFIVQVFDVMRRCTYNGGQNCGRIGGTGHTFQILTKRADRMADLCNRLLWDGDRLVLGERGGWRMLSLNPDIWMGVSVENRKHGLPRIDHLRRLHARVRFLSIEPLLEDLGEIDLTGIGWVIAGCESGPGARPMDEDWVRSIRDHCLAAGVPFFYKQRLEHGRKVETPELDGRCWTEMPDPVGAHS